MKRVASRRFDLASSRALRGFVLVSHGASAALALALPLDVPLAASIALFATALGLREWRSIERGLAGIVVRSDASVVALRSDGGAVDGTLVPGSVVLPWFATIAWRASDGGPARREGVPADRLTPPAHRELRAMLRYAGGEATSADAAGVPESHARASIRTALSALVWPAIRCR